MKIRSLPIGQKLILGFGLILLLTLLLGGLSLVQFKKLKGFTEDIHNHPMVVSNAVRDIKIDLLQIQYNLLIQISESEMDRRDTTNITHELENRIDNNFHLIKSRFLGDMKDVDQAYQIFNDLRPEIDEILILIERENLEEAVSKMTSLNTGLLTRLANQVETMGIFAHNKSETFYQNAIIESQKIVFTSSFLMAIIIVMGVTTAILIWQSISQPLAKLIFHVKKLSLGDLESELSFSFSDEVGQLGFSLREMQGNLKNVVHHAQRIATGDYSGEITPRSERDELAFSLNTMTRALKKLTEKNSYSDWIKSGENLLNEELRGEIEYQQLATQTITSLAHYVNAQVGAIYTYNREDKNLHLLASYAYNSEMGIKSGIALGEGIVGQVALEKKLITISDIPEDYMEISSALGCSSPRSIIAFPFLFESELMGVIELGTLKEWGDKEKELFTSLGENLGIIFNSAKSRKAMKDLLETRDEQAKILIRQQEELRAANEELEEKTESLIRSETLLKGQQEELGATNEELEEKTEFLERQSDEINRKNRELTSVKDDIVKKAKDLEVSSKYKSEFLANMSHELRTPLNSLMILAKDLCSNTGERLSEDDVKSAEIIYNSGNELLQLINEILDLAKIESGKINLEINEILLSDLAEGIKHQFTQLAKQKMIDLNINIAQDMVAHITTDRQKVSQVIKNLVSNAIKFTSQGFVSVSFSHPALALKEKMQFPHNEILIEVKDTGIGIAQDKMGVIFEAFKQADGSTSREYGGTGLGLSISRELASLLEGEILLESEVGKGSTFSFIIPTTIESQQEEFESHIHPPLPMAMTAPMESIQPVDDDRDHILERENSILIVEDDPQFSSVLLKICRENGFKGIVAGTGEEGFKLANECRPKAIILDVKLPGISGLQVLDLLKKERTTRHIPVHIISGDDRKNEVFDKGILGFLQKPIDGETLNKMFSQIQRVLDKKVKDLLIVEDDEHLRFAIEKLIGNKDVTKTSVATGGEAISELKKNKFDCMILDLTLPDFSGFELLKKMKDLNLEKMPPVVIYTGKEISYEEEFELRQYASSIIIKGVHSEERLLDETALFLHRMIATLPKNKQQMISKVYDEGALFKDKKILVVDDDMRNVFALSKIIEERGMIVEKAANGQKALDILEGMGDSIDLILMDIMMPVMDGYEAMKRIRKEHKYNAIPILALTAKAMKEDRQKCIDMGANDYMTKPIDPERLLSLMRVWLYK